MGRSIVDFGAELAALPEADRPGVVIFAVMTDGEENSSREYTLPAVKEMVEKQQRDYGWQVLYLGANQDAITVGESLGVRRGQTLTYYPTEYGTRSATDSMTSYVASAACGQQVAFTDAQRKDATKDATT
jgi:hypothetical protein